MQKGRQRKGKTTPAMCTFGGERNVPLRRRPNICHTASAAPAAYPHISLEMDIMKRQTCCVRASHGGQMSSAMAA
eukprot:1157126-Pelagomonas_calceolata.AAC.1